MQSGESAGMECVSAGVVGIGGGFRCCMVVVRGKCGGGRLSVGSIDDVGRHYVGRHYDVVRSARW